MRIGSWDEAKEAGLREAEKRLNAKVEKCWVDSISLEPKPVGGLWNVRLELQLRKGLRKKLVKVSMSLDPETGEVKEFKAAGSERAF